MYIIYMCVCSTTSCIYIVAAVARHTSCIYIVVAVARQDRMRLACTMCDCCPVGEYTAANLLEVNY